jgi:hypothetical protein
MAVYDDQKTDAPLVDTDDDLKHPKSDSLATGKSTAEYLKDKEGKAPDDTDNAPLSQEEQAQHDEIKKGIDKTADKPETSFSFKNDGKGKQKRTGRLSRKLKKRLIIGGGGGGLLIVVLIIFMFLSSLKLPHFMANIAAYQFARVSRNFSSSVAHVTEEKFAVDADGTFAQSLKDKYGTLRSNTWGKLDKYRPQKVLDNMKASNQLEFVTESRGRIILPGTKEVLTGIKIDGGEIKLGESKWYDYFGRRADRLEINGRLTARLESALQDSNTLVRGSVAQKIRDELDIKLRRWERLTKTYRNAKEAEAAEIKRTTQATDTEPSEGSSVNSVQQAEEDAQKLADDCLADEACLEKQAETDAKDIATKTADKININLNTNALTTAANTVSSLYAVALPVCMIYDGSVEHSGSTADANSDRAVKTYYSLASAADQQKAGDADPSQIGGLNDELGDISSAPSETRASGRTVDTNAYTNPEANTTQDYNVFGALFGGNAGKFFGDVLSPVCPYVTNPYVGFGAGLIEIGATVLTGGTYEAAGKTVEATATQIIGRMISETLSKEGLQTLGKTFVRDATLITGGTILAKLLVIGRMGNMQSSIPNSSDLQLQADQGGNLTAGGIDRQQLYGAPMKTEDVAMSNYQDYQDIAYENSQRSLFDRYLNPDNPNSALANTAIGLSSTLEKSIPSIMQDVVKRIGSLFQPNSSLFSSFLTGNQKRALAATTANNYNIVQWGWTAGEEAIIESNPDLYSPINNAEALERSGKLESLKEKYDKCFTKSIGDLLADGSIVRDGDGNISPDKGSCAPNNLGPANPDAFQYRVYMRNQGTLDHLNAIQNYSAGVSQE